MNTNFGSTAEVFHGVSTSVAPKPINEKPYFRKPSFLNSSFLPRFSQKSHLSFSSRSKSISKAMTCSNRISNGGLTYKDAGVDIDAGSELVRRIAKMAPGIGGFGGHFPLGLSLSLSLDFDFDFGFYSHLLVMLRISLNCCAIPKNMLDFVT